MRAIVTGAASGIGRAVVWRFARDARAAGGAARLLLVDRDCAGLDLVAGEVAALGGIAVPFAADLADPAAITAIGTRAAEELDGLDALVSNAGYFPPGLALMDMGIDAYERMFAVNTRATWLLVKHTRGLLARARGAVVATASISAREPTPSIGNYSAAKAALVMLIRQMAFELGAEGIRCNCVSPGSTQTGINEFLLRDPAVRARRGGMLPLGRIGQPEDVANVIAFLAGPGAAYVTGADLLVDGGLNLTLMDSLVDRTRMLTEASG